MTSKKTQTKSGAPSKAGFVRSLSGALTAREVVEKAKAENIKISEHYVYNIRAAKKSKKSSAAKKAGKAARTAQKGTKSAFVIALPQGLSAAEVVQKGKAAGVALSIAHVYAIRSTDRRKHGGGTRAHRPTAALATRGSSTTTRKQDHAVEGQFIRLALALGSARAAQLLERLVAKVAKLKLD